MKIIPKDSDRLVDKLFEEIENYKGRIGSLVLTSYEYNAIKNRFKYITRYPRGKYENRFLGYPFTVED